jgi:heat shock protein HslJ
MKNTTIFVVLLSILVGFGVVFISLVTPKAEAPTEVVPEVTSTDFKNTTYIIDGAPVTLTDGVSELRPTGDNESMIVTRYFGNEVFTDLNDDGLDDVVFLVTQDMGGSGTFFFVVAGIRTANGYQGSEAFLLGDRIAPQNTEVGPGKQVIVNYADRAPGEPMSTSPTLGKSVRLILDIETLQFGVVENDFPGEADPARMTLDMKTWEWVRAEYGDGRTVTPLQAGTFTLSFAEDGSVAVGTDCNSVGADAVIAGNQLTFENVRMTKMYCEGSQESEFLKLLEDTAGYHFTDRGELVLDLRFDSGVVILR